MFFYVLVGAATLFYQGSHEIFGFICERLGFFVRVPTFPCFSDIGRSGNKSTVLPVCEAAGKPLTCFRLCLVPDKTRNTSGLSK